MLDIKYIRENPDEIKQNCKKRGVKVDIDKLIEFDEQRRNLLQQIETIRSQKNKKSKSKPTEKEMKKMKENKKELKRIEEELKRIEKNYNDLMMSVPNMTHPDAPVGSEENFKVLEEHGDIPKFDFKPKDHEQLLTKLDLLDFERGAKTTGSKFYFYKGDMVRLNQALINYGIDVVTKHGYELMETPDMVRQEILEASGFNPRGQESQIYKVEEHDLHLIGTAEISVLGYHANETLDLSKGPKKYTALSHCFRTEAGSYGKAVKGLYRVHQFTKLEMFIFCKPDESEKLLEELLDIEKEICDGLGLSYRVIDTPTGDLGGPAYRKYDIEAWMAFKKDYGEITSCSNCTDYQARRLNIRYKDKKGSALVHTLNGTAMVSTRFPLAIVEQYQKKDGSIEVPEVLLGYMDKSIIK